MAVIQSNKGEASAFSIILLILILFLLGAWMYFPDMQAWQKNQTQTRCVVDADCVPVVFECGYCPDATFAVHKEDIVAYEELYAQKCSSARLKRARSCETPPAGTAVCENRQCVLQQ